MRRLLVLACALALLNAAQWYRQRPIRHPPGVLVAAEPVQTDPTRRAAIRQGGFELVPLADYAIEARVLSRQAYRFDHGAALAPLDLAVGWKRMSDSAVLDRLELSQAARYFTWRWHGAPPLPAEEITRSVANMHVIGVDPQVARELARVRVGQIVTLRGQLVEARDERGGRWTSSLRRDDSGAGACELMLVESVARGY